ncbi:HAMP domain-containing sensor histidine kinase [Streptomyces solisilvae]|uniref:sensor histidine kinase n=1 Tax=Streptomyces malaysiensis TaxID=92644 RepID=UPI000BFB175C|nr:HAMP domain-containing sensor histidine kinase [Streptomyces malaysiensis]ATL85246.1 signal transduction histidine kinase-like protein [Streptomyces malaysiensis]QDL70984.1 sensor histidine kinase [Streptomyces malaysiensis]
MNSERARLTALYTGLLVLAGVLLTTLVYVLLQQSLDSRIGTAVTQVIPANSYQTNGPTAPQRNDAAFGRTRPMERPMKTSEQGKAVSLQVKEVSDAAGDAALSRLLTVSGASLAAFTILSAALAWWMAGRVLRPVGVITAKARQLSAENLHERLALESPGGELKELADTFDEMLDRIEHLVAARQRFAANAAHELRTSVAVQRAAAEIGLADDPPPEKVARMRSKLIENADGSERLIESLLLLAVSDRQLQRREHVAMHDITARCTDGLRDEAARRSIALHVETAEPLSVEGDPVLLEHTVHNLVSNGLRYNHPGGSVRVRVDADGVEVANTGPVVPCEDVPRLFEPFRRARERGHRRDPSDGGAGLGLSIVASIARAHDATTHATANPDGGLTIRVRFHPTAAQSATAA